MKRSYPKATVTTGNQHGAARHKTFSTEEIRKYIDPGPPTEAAKFVRLIYEERRHDREESAPE